MKIIRKQRFFKYVAVTLIVNLLLEIFFPPVALALTAGPNSPEFSSFEPVATTDMVHPFTGDFTYNLPMVEIPGPDGAGYALSLSYHSGTSAEEEASWVGYGWTLSPGAVNRGLRGFPDDYNGDAVKQYNKTIPSWSASASEAIGAEIFSVDEASSTDTTTNYTAGFNLSTRKSLRFNNYQGFVREVGMGIGMKGIGVNMNWGAQGVTFGANVNVAGIFTGITQNFIQEIENNGQTRMDKYMNKLKKYLLNKIVSSASGMMNSRIGSTYGLFTWSEAVRPLMVSSSQGISFNWSSGFSINPAPLPFGLQIGEVGNFNMQWTKTSDLDAYGYMNSPSGPSDRAASDYYVEKNYPYQKRNLFLGMPFNNADNFMVTGEGLAGGFRYYPENLRQFFPTQKESKTRINQMGVEVSFGSDVGIGLDFGVGYNKLHTKTWGNPGNAVEDNFKGGSNNGLFRFNNDLGGKVEYGDNSIANADLRVLSFMPGAKYADISFDGQEVTPSWSSGSQGRSSYIRPLGNGKIEGFSIVNENGVSYTYGQPVHARKETAVQVNVPRAARPDDKYIAFGDLYMNAGFLMDESQHRVVVGEHREGAYATSCLLTQITGVDYVDLGAEGADSADFGAWTKFAYHQSYGADKDNYYRWRTPYTGLSYQQGQLSTVKDDMGSVQTGEKEVYYLKAVETKTHIAYFVTNRTYASRFALLPSDTSFINGSQKPRLDGRGAWKITGSKDYAANGSKGTQETEYLEKIVLYSKARMDKPLKTVNFEYDYSLVKNLPNNVNGLFPKEASPAESGKLTLKKVWFDYEGVVSSRISPYEFVYKYKDKTSFPKEIQERYPEFIAANLNYSDAAQNPDYSPQAMDAWGNVQLYGKERRKDLNPWLYQGDYPTAPLNISEGPVHWKNRIQNEPAGFFDPAAWQLKQIKLPSGGEILVDYEQKDYRFVQDRQVMSMVSLFAYDDETTDIVGQKMLDKNPVYYLNLSDVGIDTMDSDFKERRKELMRTIQNYFGPGGDREKVFFRFLYNLSSDADIPDLDRCSSEYISGYARFLSCDSIVRNGKECLKITLQGESSSHGEYTHVPRQACYDFVATQRIGKVNTTSAPQTANDECESEYDQKYQAQVDAAALAESKKQARAAAKDILNDLGPDMSNSSTYQIPPKATVCVKMNPRLSYLKLPMIRAKRGGGVRVKRLLMYDPGMETGDAGLYGSEFIYQDQFGKSSGVATNEPSEMREENPLISFMPRKNQSFFSRITAGQDREQTEGPLGESILPAPSVGHSRVVVKNIHAGKTGTGFMVYEFHTVKDYPYDRQYIDGKGVDHTDLGENSLKDRMSIAAGLFRYSTQKVWATQGFRFIIHQMHGQKKNVSTYGGDYSDMKHAHLTSSETYTYYEPGEKVSLISYTNGQFNLRADNPGKEMDVTMEMNAVHDNTLDFSVEVDITIGVPALTIFVGAWPTIDLSENIIRTHTTTKIMRYPVLLKSVTAYKDGATTTVQNLAFNEHTGQPVITRTADSYDQVTIQGKVHNGSIYQTNIPASWIYPGMGQMASGGTNQLNESAGRIVSYGKEGNPFTGTRTSMPWFFSPENVLSASVQTYSRDWSSSWNDPLVDGQFGTAAHAEDLNKVYRPWQTFVYKDSVVPAAEAKTYNSGMYHDFRTYWSDTTNPKWLKVNQVGRYSPHGSVLEEHDVLGIPSAARFGYANNAMPVMIAGNSDYSSLFFEDYENAAGAASAIAHTGYRSLPMPSGSTFASMSLNNVSALGKRGGIVSLWVHQDPAASSPLSLKVQINASEMKADRIARTGAWALYRAVVPAEAFSTGQCSLRLLYNEAEAGTIYVDDVKVQPVDAQATCYVYDVKSLRLLAQFDDWHFGMLYQYNDEGRLVRKQVETERGVKTVQETQYNLPKVNRP